jgi:hypothetical protein
MNNWHSETIAKLKTLPIESLEYIRWDAHRAATIGETIDNPKTAQYWDEYHYACMELNRRVSNANQ